MTISIDASLNEAWRDAMLGLYLHEYVPNNPYLIEKGLVTQITTANDLYEFLLLDVLIAQQVPTSPVACAIASLQQLVNGMMLNMEPGYGDNSLTPHQVKAWGDGLNRYPIWAAIQQLQHFPDIYLDPTLRLTKTASFEQLENDINQAQIQPETVQAAVLAYLARFEEISNLTVCNGYIDGEHFANSPYYFIAKSPAESAYYWRSLDMCQRPVIESAAQTGDIPTKYDKPLPAAWTDWQRANVPIPESALEHTIRPCWFNNRLFVIWAEVEYQDPDAMASEVSGVTVQNSIKTRPRFRLYASYKKYDDSWSTPRVYIESYCQTPALIEKTPEEIASQTQTIAVYDHSTSPESMVLMLYSNYQPGPEVPAGTPETGKDDKYDFLRTVRIDKNFHVSSLFPASGSVTAFTPLHVDPSQGHVRLIGRIFAHKNRNRFQYWLPSGLPDFGAVTNTDPKEEKNTWDFNEWQSRIKASVNNNGIIYDKARSNIELTVSLEESFSDVQTVTLSIFDRTDTELELFELTLVFNESSFHDSRYILLEGSVIKPTGTDWLDQSNATFQFTTNGGWKNLIIERGTGDDSFSIPRTPKGGSASLRGKRLYKHMLDDILHSENNYLTECRRYAGGWKKLYLSPKVTSTQSGPYQYQLFVAHPIDVRDEKPTTFAHMRELVTLPLVSTLAKDSTLTYTFSIDQTTHQPDGWPGEWPAENLTIPLIYGVLIHENGQLIGGALKALTVGWAEALNQTLQVAPSINAPSVDDSPSLGKAQFIDFTGSSIAVTDEAGDLGEARAPIRMNTVFARHLIERAEIGMDALLSWETQNLKEPPIAKSQGAEPMDFSGAYGLYFLELFLYVPWLLAHRFNQEQQYEVAKQWLAYAFDPARQSSSPGHPGYWQAVPLEEPVSPQPMDPSQSLANPYDPHLIALSFPVHFRKALYGLYIDIESNQADAAYRELTPDGLAEAKLRYVRILDLLGARPDVWQVDDWTSVSLHTLSTASNTELREFEQQLVSAHQHLQDHPPQRIGPAPDSQAAPLLCLRPYAEDRGVLSVDNPYLRRSFNPELIQRWDRAESRLYNLRHNLDMAGSALNLPLFAARLDPRALLAASAQGLSGAALNRLLSPQIPHYRFGFMFALAQNAVESVMQFGSTLLSLIERKEQAQYLELQQQQAWNLAKVALDIQVQAGKIDEANKKALLASQATIAQRVSYYEKLVNEGVSRGEILAGSLQLGARVSESVANTAVAVGELAKIPPNMFGAGVGVGFAFSMVGGWRLEGLTRTLAATAQGVAGELHSASETIGLYEHYRRRAQEWTQARDQAKLEAAQIKVQLEVFEAQHIATQLQLRQSQTALNQAKATHDFLLGSNRFSKSQTYDWLNSKFAGFYYSAYTTAQSLCQAAEACWQYEMGDFTQTFIRPGAWNNSYRGLGAGEELKVSLQQMYREYVQHNQRDLEIRKTVSLKELKAKDDEAINQTWEEIKDSLVSSGTCEFELTQKMFDDDYAGEAHYLRRIKTISVSLPVTVGPYQDICAVLSQSYSKVEMAATVGTIKENLRPSQQIALSHGVDDYGQFQLNFQDERYLPFEYTGAISRWILTFPNPTTQEAMLRSLTDIIVHVSYTARRGAGSL
ncbi:Tc toxin subunit A-related protein [Pseudomonas sp. RA_35y_Pfl2_P32]|uniref:Tc toxin subunit A-related protein n=1 Tax=Pseudomonas sp. RA_35y_Pfl2_P32 TaxID=3088705 RepID=UPI0030DD33D5